MREKRGEEGGSDKEEREERERERFPSVGP